MINGGIEMAGTSRRTIYKGNVERRVLMQPGHSLPNMERGQNLASFTPGIRSFTFGTPLLLEAGVLPTGPGYEYRMSDYVCVAHAFEQPKVYGTYFGGTYGRTEPNLTDKEKSSMLRALDDINKNYAIKDMSMADDIRRLGMDPDAYSRIWDSVYSDPEKYHVIRTVLLNAELSASRSLAYGVFSAGAAPFADLEKAFERTAEKINKLEISDKTRNIMLAELEAFRERCIEKTDRTAKVVPLDSYNEVIRGVERKVLGAEYTRFMDLLSEEVAQVKWRKAIPEMEYIHKEELRRYFDILNETSPDGMVDVNEKIYEEIAERIENESKVIHSYHKPYKPLTDAELDNISAEDTPLPFMILYSITASNDAADRHEASITISDGKSCTFEKISMDSDGNISSARANVGINGVIADLDKEADRDASSDRKEVEYKTEVAEKAPEKAVQAEPDITEVVAVAAEGVPFEEEEFFDEI